MLEGKWRLDLMHMCERMREWMHVAEIMIHHPFFRREELTSPDGFSTKMSQYTMISDEVWFEFSKFEKESGSLSVIADGKHHTEIFHQLAS